MNTKALKISPWQNIRPRPGRIFSAAVFVGLATFLNASAGTIGGTNIDWNNWSQVKGLPAARYSLAAGVLDNRLYAVGGGLGGVAQTNVYKYDGTNWSEVIGLPAERRFLAADVLDNRLYAIAGLSGGFTYTNVYRFDGTNWSEGAGLPAERPTMAAGVLDNRLYAVGGGIGGTAYTNVYRYDGTNWSEVVGLPAARSYLAAAVLDGVLYAVGGYNAGAKTNVYRFDGTNWSEVAGLPAARFQQAAAVLSNALYAIGGDYDNTAQTNVYRFDGANWSEIAGLPATRKMMAAGVLDGVLYAVGGYIYSAETNVYRYPGLNFSGVNPSSGSITGGYRVTISGTGLGNGSDITNVTLSGASAASIDSQSATQVVITASPGAPGLGHVRVYSTSQGETIKSNGFIYLGVTMTLRGTNGTAIVSGEPAAAGKGTDFGSLAWGNALTNTFSITNNGNNTLTISGWTTNGDVASAFSIFDFPFSISAGTRSNFTIRFAPPSAGIYTASVQIVNNSTTTPYSIYLAGAGAKHDQTITNFPNPGEQLITNTVLLSAQASSGLPVTNFTVSSGPGTISGLSNLTFNGSGLVSITVSQAGDTNWNPAPVVTNTFSVVKLGQAISFSAIGDQAVTSVVPLSAAADSGLPVSFSVGSGPGAISGGTNVAFTGAVLVSIVASQTGNNFYVVAPDVTNTFSVVKLGQAISFSAIGDQAVTSVVPLSAAADSGLPVSFSVGSGPGAISGGTNVAFTGAGVVSIVASQTGNNFYAAALDVTNTFNVVATTPAGEGSLTVTIFPADAVAAGAMWRLAGGAWRASGTIATGLTAGGYTVGFADVPGYTNPADQTVTISANQLAAVTGMYWLLSGDLSYRPVSADYDGDRLADPALYRPADGLWLARLSGIGYQWSRMASSFGQSGYTPVGADFDGDFYADPGLYNTTNGEWRIQFSSLTYLEYFFAALLGGEGYTAFAADFDGDGKADPAVYNPAAGDWQVRLSGGGHLVFAAEALLGQNGFAAAAGDLDGDQKADPFVCRMATGQCQALLSRFDYYRIQSDEQFLGAPGWLLTLADYDGDGFADPAVYDPSSGALALRLSLFSYQLLALPEFLKP